MKKYIFFILFSFSFVSLALAATATATPTKYEITLQQVELYNGTTGTWEVVGSGTVSFNIAEANAGAAVGAYMSNIDLPAGTYTSIRFRVARNIIVNATAAIGATTYYTTSTQYNNFGDPIQGNNDGRAIVISAVAANAADGTFMVPSDAPPGGFPTGYSNTLAGDYFQGTVTTPLFTAFTYTPGGKKKITLNFDVTGKATFIDNFPPPGGANIICYIDPPVVSVAME